MKRSRHLKLVLMAAVPVALTACQAEPTGTVVQTVAECQAGGWMTPEQCEIAHNEALAAHATSAPRYESQADCEAEFGQCTPAKQEGAGEETPQGQRTAYMPPMTGFLIGYMLGNMGGRRMAPGPGNAATYTGAAPLYRTRADGAFHNARGDAVAKSSGTVFGARGALPAPGRAVTVSRGGFGARGSFTGGRGA